MEDQSYENPGPDEVLFRVVGLDFAPCEYIFDEPYEQRCHRFDVDNMSEGRSRRPSASGLTIEISEGPMDEIYLDALRFLQSQRELISAISLDEDTELVVLEFRIARRVGGSIAIQQTLFNIDLIKALADASCGLVICNY